MALREPATCWMSIRASEWWIALSSHNPVFTGHGFQPSTGAVKKLSKNFAMALAMSEQDVITPLTFGAPNSPAR
ncbi:hypothetical protein EXN61_02035 [Agrobacterium tumefaciens]|uniref:Uncharacterized protein n=1 Tax=Agrobacterium tumefaciens TaxID=358 RepID=A0A546Y6Y9_AGRTU|nr:hypothetical protein EXN61_02035 [Agrobacterium tumefaciens]